MARLTTIAGAVFVFLYGAARAETVLYNRLDSLDGWTVRAVGDAKAALVAGREGKACAEMASTGGTVFLTRSLPAGMFLVASAKPVQAAKPGRDSSKELNWVWPSPKEPAGCKFRTFYSETINPVLCRPA